MMQRPDDGEMRALRVADHGNMGRAGHLDGTVQHRATGIRDAGWVEITQGLAPGDLIVAKAGAFVRDGDRITPVPVKE